jgi:4-hydroxy-2-oxoglutarate aldolase
VKLEGVVLPVTTPFDRVTGDPAPIPFRANLRAWLEAGVHGFVLAGSTGEAPLLDPDEIVKLAEWARDVVPPERTLLAGAGLESTRATIRLARALADAHVDGVLVRAPAYYRKMMDAGALRAHFEAVADASPVPVVLYHVPQFVPVEIGAGLLAELGAHPNVAGIKDSTGDLKSIAAFLDAAPEGCAVMVGAGTKLYAALEMGAAGGIIAVGCIAPRLAVDVHDRFRAGDMSGAGATQARMGPVHETVVRDLGVPGVKFALELVGFAGGPPRPPLRPLNDAGRSRVRPELERAGLLDGEA